MRFVLYAISPWVLLAGIDHLSRSGMNVEMTRAIGCFALSAWMMGSAIFLRPDKENPLPPPSGPEARR